MCDTNMSNVHFKIQNKNKKTVTFYFHYTTNFNIINTCNRRPRYIIIHCQV